LLSKFFSCSLYSSSRYSISFRNSLILNLSTTAEKTNTHFFKDKNFDYKGYFEKCKAEFETIIAEYFSKVTVKKKEEIARLVCHTLLKIQTQPTPGLAPSVADAIAKQLCNTAEKKEDKILEDSGAIEKTTKSKKENKNPLIQAFLNCITEQQPATKSHSFTLYCRYYQADGIQIIRELAKTIDDPNIFFTAAKSIAQGRLARWAWRDPKTIEIYKALVESKNLEAVINKLQPPQNAPTP